MIWALALAIYISITILVGRKHIQLAPNIFHLPERMGLFTLIVLGETIFGLVSSLSDHEWSIESTISIGAGLGIAFSLWWVYFDSIYCTVIRAFREKGRIGVYTTWLFIHFPLVVGLVANTTGIKHVVSSAQNIAISYTGELVICGSMSLCLLPIGVIQLCVANASVNAEKKRLMIQGSAYRFIAGFVIVLIPIPTIVILPLVLILIISVICIMQILLDLRLHPHRRIF